MSTISLAVVASLSSGCGTTDGSGTTDGKPTQVSLKGSVQKGPFVLGSTITVSPLDADGNPTGQAFLTQTSNDKGEFAVSFTTTGQVSLQGEGFYYNELLGSLSGAPITLRALYVPQQSGTQAAYLNVITHLTYLRIRHLVGVKVSFASAVAEAEKELRDELALTAPNFDPGATGIATNLLGGDTPATEYLLATSAVLLKAASLSGPADGALQQLLNVLATDMEEDGKLTPSNKGKVAAGLAALNPYIVMDHLAKRLDELGANAPVPDITKILTPCELCGKGNPCSNQINTCECHGDGECSASGKCVVGACKAVGTGMPDKPCSFHLQTDDCAKGVQCIWPDYKSPGVCRLRCDATTICPPGTQCKGVPLSVANAFEQVEVCIP